MANKALKEFDKQLAQIYTPQEQFLQQQYEATLPQFAAQEASLQQAKLNAFRDIGDVAQRRGMFFSGFQPTEQARYVGEKFLPGLAAVEQGRQQAKLGMLEALTGLRTKAAEQRLSFRETLRQEAVQRAQEKKRFERELKMQDRSFQQQRALARSSGGGSRGTSSSDYRALLSAATSDMAGRLKGKAGKDGYVSPKTFNAARTAWLNAGLDANSFNKNFRSFAPPGKRAKRYNVK